ncbi:MAG: type IV secretion system protein [Sphingobium sp.]
MIDMLTFATMGVLDGLGSWFRPQASLGEFYFFHAILDYLTEAISDFGYGMMGRMMDWVGAIVLTLLTLWVLIQGFRIVTGQSRDSMMVLVANAAKATLIVSVAVSMGIFGADMHQWLTQKLPDEITAQVTGEDESAADQIDENMAWMSVALTTINAVDVVDNPTLADEKTRAMIFAGIGTGGPALVAGAMLLLYQVAIALFVGLGPLFILCLLFDVTKSLFQKWLFYGLGTMFSMAVLAAMTSIALKMVTAVSEAFWGAALVGSFLDMDAVDGISSQAMQQGGLGLLLTTLIITAPPMAAMFFQGTLGGFSPYATMGPHLDKQGGAPGGHPGNAGGGYAQQPERNTTGPGVGAIPSRIAGAPATPSASEGQGTFGAANKLDRG